MVEESVFFIVAAVIAVIAAEFLGMNMTQGEKLEEFWIIYLVSVLFIVAACVSISISNRK